MNHATENKNTDQALRNAEQASNFHERILAEASTKATRQGIYIIDPELGVIAPSNAGQNFRAQGGY